MLSNTSFDSNVVPRMAPGYPAEVFNAPYLTQLPYKTLQTLGLKSSKAAADAGYICVRPSFVVSRRALPGLWLAPADMPLFEAECEKIRAKKLIDQEQTIAQAAQTTQDAALKAVQSGACEVGLKERELFNTLSQFFSVSEQEARTAIPTDWVSLLTPSLCSRKQLFYQLLDLAGVKLPQGVKLGKKKNFTYNGASFTAPGPVLFKAILSGDSGAVAAAIFTRYAEQLNKAADLEKKWLTHKPDWFPARTLHAWCQPALRMPRDAHPVTKLFKDYGIETIQVTYKTVKFSASVRALPLKDLWSSQKRGEEPLITWLIDQAQTLLLVQVLTHLSKVAPLVEAQLPQNAFDSEPARQEAIETAFLQEYHLDCRAETLVPRTVTRLSSRLREQAAAQALRQSTLGCKEDLPSELKDFYPLARSLERRITFLMGPTNSGKTHTALQYLKAAQSGIYLGPLRLLALEVHERLLDEGIPNSLVTGELVVNVPDARHWASTIEMLDLNTPVEVAVVDEVQMLADPERGSAWLEAVLGAPAEHLVLVGAEAALPLVQRLAEHTGEPLEIVRLQRFTPIEVLQTPTPLSALEDGTALIVFSRRDALGLAAHISRKTHKKVAVVYGALSPEVRREQARLFRSGEAPILVATDAIGMGLNLPIKTLLFTTLFKWNGKTENVLSSMLFHQIAGRTGRYGLHEKGFIGALAPDVLKRVNRMIDKSPESLSGQLLMPLSGVVAHTVAKNLGTTHLPEILNFFKSQLTWQAWATPSVTESQLFMAQFLESFHLSLDQKLSLLNAPAIHRNYLCLIFNDMVRAVECNRVLNGVFRPYEPESRANKLEALEDMVRDTTLYCWMHYRYPVLFPDIDAAKNHLNQLNQEITQELQRQAPRRCNRCGKGLPWNHAYRICDRCYHGSHQFWNF